MDFVKAHGTANDFVVIGDPTDAREISPALVRALCDRRRGIGADGVIRIGGPRDGAQVFMDYRNADGSIVEMCGNGVRVVAKYVVDRALVEPEDDDTVLIATRAGVKPVRVELDAAGCVENVVVDMGAPAFDPADVPFVVDDDAPPRVFEHRIEVAGSPIDAAVLSMGNPHAVIRVDDVDAAPVTTVGPRLETHERFPARVNVGFAQVVDRDEIRLRVWERGVGETAACGTGACAAIVALNRQGLVGDDVAVRVPGGTLRVWLSGGTVLMRGPAVEVASGTVDRSWLAAVEGVPVG